MDLSERQQAILVLIRQQRQVRVEPLAVHFQVTTQTIRRDLNDLCRRGLAARIHGGATQLHSVTNVAYDERRLIAIDSKQRIGREAARLIPDNCSIILNIGTTAEQVARALTDHNDLVVVSNNINVINILSRSTSKQLFLAGGMVRQSDGAVVGTEAVEFIERFKTDYAVIGASAIDEDGAVLDFDSREVSVARAILKNARVKILVADNTKFQRTALVRICTVADIDVFITDQAPPPSFAAACARGETEVVLAEPCDTVMPMREML